MSLIEYRSPNGEITEFPNIEKILQTIREPSVEVWEAGSGGASMMFEKANGETCLLMLFFDECNGFFLEHRPDVKRHIRFFSIGSENMDDLITIYVSGEPTRLPKGVFVTQQAALVAAEEFVKTGERSSQLTWRNRNEISWDDEGAAL